MMARVKDGDRAALLREAEAVLAAHGDKSNCAERVFLALRAITETDIPPEAVCLLTGLGGGVGGAREGTCGAITGGVAALGLIHGRRNPPDGDRLWTYEVCRISSPGFRPASAPPSAVDWSATCCGTNAGSRGAAESPLPPIHTRGGTPVPRHVGSSREDVARA